MRPIVCLLLIVGISFISCKKDPIIEEIVEEQQTNLASITLYVGLCNAMEDPTCIKTNPINQATVYLYDTEEAQDLGEVLSVHETGIDGRTEINNLEPSDYFLTVEYMGETIEHFVNAPPASNSFERITFIQ